MGVFKGLHFLMQLAQHTRRLLQNNDKPVKI
jgi:hypothetical protein